jgi:hypothetical protein
MIQNIKIPNFQDLEKILHDNLVEKAIDALANRHDDEDDATINGLEDD